jgi:hypothetical protein
MDNKQHYALPIAAGAGLAFVFAMVTSLVGSVLPPVSCCVCLAGTLGSILSIYLLQQKVGAPIETKEAAIVGTAVGGVLFVLFFGFASIFMLVMGASAIPGLRDMPGDAQAAFGGSMALILGVICGVNLFHVLFGALGGVVGAALFKNQAGGNPPGGGGGPGAGGFGPPGGGAPGGFGQAPGSQPGGFGPPGGAPPAGGFGQAPGSQPGGAPGGFGQAPGSQPGGPGQSPGGQPGGFGQAPGSQPGGAPGGFGQAPGSQPGGGFGQPPGGQNPQGGGWGQQ